jgi:hypothetical protein
VSAEAAKQSLAHRLTRPADRLRQFYTRFGLRSTKVFLVWTKWSGKRRGEGKEEILTRVELLPTPRVTDETAIRRNPRAQGILPEGTLRIDQISAGAYTADNLRGLVIPGLDATSPHDSRGQVVGGSNIEPESNDRIDFFYELAEDGRGENPAERDRYRLLGGPDRKEGSLYFAVNIERASEDTDRLGETQEAVDDV